MDQESKIDLENLIVQHEVNFLKNLEVVLSGFIHDLNNPIAVISGQSSILKTLIEMNKATEEKSLNSANKILSSTQKMGTIIQSLRNFYKPPLNDANQANLKLTLETIFHLSHAKIFRSELNVSANLLENDFWISSDSIELNLIIWNIHFYLLDLMIQTPASKLNISAKNQDQLVCIQFNLTDLTLPANCLQSTELRLAKHLIQKQGGEFMLNNSQITINIKN